MIYDSLSLCALVSDQNKQYTLYQDLSVLRWMITFAWVLLQQRLGFCDGILRAPQLFRVGTCSRRAWQTSCCCQSWSFSCTRPCLSWWCRHRRWIPSPNRGRHQPRLPSQREPGTHLESYLHGIPSRGRPWRPGILNPWSRKDPPCGDRQRSLRSARVPWHRRLRQCNELQCGHHTWTHGCSVCPQPSTRGSQSGCWIGATPNHVWSSLRQIGDFWLMEEQIRTLRDHQFILQRTLWLLTSDVIAIGCGTSTGAENVGCQLVKLLAVLVSNDWASCGSGIGSEGNTSLKSKQRDIDISNPFSSVWLLVHPLNKIYMSSSHVAATVLTLKIAPQIVVPVLVKLILGFIFA